MEASFGDTALVHMEFGRAYVESDFPGKAVSEFKKAIAKNPRLPEAHYSLAAAYLASADSSSLDKANAELKKELQVSPKDFLTYAALGHIAVIQHRYGEAESYLKHAIALNPANPDAYLYLGQMNYEMHRSADAEAALRKAIANTRDASRNRYQIQKAHYLLGRLLAKSGDQAGAQAEMQIVQKMMARTLTRDKDRFSGMAPGANTIAAAESPATPADEKEAGKVANFRKQIAEPLADSYNNLGAIAASGKDYTTALACFQHAAEWNRGLPGLDYNWGRAAFMSSHFKQAVPPLTRYLKDHAEDASIRSVLGISLFMTKDYAAVIQTLQPTLPRIGAVPQVEYVYAASLVKTGHSSEGVRMLRAMEQKNPSIPDVHRSLAEAYAAGGKPDLERAEEEFAAAIRLNPSDAEAHYELGKLEMALGEVKPAIAELETAVQLGPDDAAAHAALAAAYRQDSRPEDAKRELELSRKPPAHAAAGPR
jgi:tetratricopeptide (TPR) repeat protein